MPVLDALPHLTIILGLKGILDFYYWKGVPCVRKWPVIPPSSRSPRSLESARLFGAIVAAYSLLGAALKDLFALDAADQTRTARDLFVSAVLGHLHDHNMSDFLDLLTEATAYLEALAPLADTLLSIGTDQLLARAAYDGADWQALLVDAQRHLQADIIASALPATAATDANQATIIAHLNLITKLEHALESVDTDRLQVRGEDQLFSLRSTLLLEEDTVISGANGWCQSTAVPAGERWNVLHVFAMDITSATTAHNYGLQRAAASVYYHRITAAMPATYLTDQPCNLWLDPDDRIRVAYTGALAGDTCRVGVLGKRMTIET